MMRAKYSEIVEKGRDRRDPYYASEPGERDGRFRLTCPATGEKLLVIVGTGETYREVGLAGEPWDHVSVSTPRRCPTWEEMSWIKSLFFDDSECVIQFHPPRASYVNDHPFVLHLWRPLNTVIPMPPINCV